MSLASQFSQSLFHWYFTGPPKQDDVAQIPAASASPSRTMSRAPITSNEDADFGEYDDVSGDVDPNFTISDNGIYSLTQLMSFRLSTSTPLLLVSKHIHSEVTRLLEDLQELLVSQIYLQRIKEPTQPFLEIASRSRFVVIGGPIETLFLVKHLPAAIKPLVREMAFALQTWDDAGPLWGTLQETSSEVTNTLCSELPNLRTIAMEVPQA
ncbi:hypothetical protein OPT61_g5730 [Boeremia exigua]|uniref:Uncharacterized protein n=1 Tax=Boeremia exigua TaxID=749465 RepID=A0ACC2I980_9PLEO|nr:hypothetical protein OPT61_g5730 [Boeremia exigua]